VGEVVIVNFTPEEKIVNGGPTICMLEAEMVADAIFRRTVSGHSDTSGCS
jgi:hypothetical protein